MSNWSFWAGVLPSGFAVVFFGRRNQHPLFPIAGIQTNCEALFASDEERRARRRTQKLLSQTALQFKLGIVKAKLINSQY
jgi:hypothetical protein